MNTPTQGGNEPPYLRTDYKPQSIGLALSAFLEDCSPLYKAAVTYFKDANAEISLPNEISPPLWREVARQLVTIRKRQRLFFRGHSKTFTAPRILFAALCASLPFGEALAALVAGERPACPAQLAEQGLQILWDEFTAEAEAVLERKRAFAEKAAKMGSRTSAAKTLAAIQNGRKRREAENNPTTRTSALCAREAEPNIEVEVEVEEEEEGGGGGTPTTATTTTKLLTEADYTRFAARQGAEGEEATRFGEYNARTGFRKPPQEAWKAWTAHRTPTEQADIEQRRKCREAHKAAEQKRKAEERALEAAAAQRAAEAAEAERAELASVSEHFGNAAEPWRDKEASWAAVVAMAEKQQNGTPS